VSFWGEGEADTGIGNVALQKKVKIVELMRCGLKGGIENPCIGAFECGA